jgi:hypothetical protein
LRPGGGFTGKVIRKELPTPTVDSHSIVPPIAWMQSAVIANPSPDPVTPSCVSRWAWARKNRSKIAARSASGMPRPLSRTRILTERFVAGALAVAVPVFATTLTIPALAARVGATLEFGPLLLCAVQESLLLLAIYAIGFFLSSISRSPFAIAFTLLFFTIFEFAIYLVEKATHWSVFRLADVERFLDIQTRGSLDPRASLPLLAIVAAGYVASLIAFRRRTP